MTIAELQTKYALMKRDITDVTDDTFILWCDNLNQYVYNFLLGVDPERFVSTRNYTVTDSPQTESLPSDFKNIQPKGCGFFYIDDEDEETTSTLNRTGYGRRDRGYYITGTNVVFTGIESSEKYTLRYIPVLTTLSATSDSLVLDEEYAEYLIRAVDVLYSIWDEEVGMESFADARYVRALDALAAAIRKEPSAYDLPDFTLYY